MPQVQWRQVKKSLKTQFQFEDLRPGQEEIIRSVLAGENTLAVMPTGAGKSLCYQLPALHLAGTTIVISPLISLMKDQCEKVEGHGIGAVELNSSLTRSKTLESIGRIGTADTEIIYVTPERFTSAEFLATVSDHEIDFVVIDEAHCVSQWGHDFRPAFLQIGEALKILGRPPVLALTATATEDVADDIQKQLGLKMRVFRSSILRENLQFEVNYMDSPDEKFEAVLKLAEEMREDSGIIYTATVAAAKELHEALAERGIPSLLYHGKLSASERTANQNEFMHSTPRLMIATNAFGMGIDKADIRFVMHYQFPGSLESYYQEAGRAGRDGKPARCILFYLKRDKSTQSLFLSGKYPSADEVQALYVAMKAGAGTTRDQLIEGFAGRIAKTKIAVILSMMKQMKIVKDLKGQLSLLKSDLSAVAIEGYANVYKERAERDQKKLTEVIRYAQSALCRWNLILEYFQEKPVDGFCGHCDNCLNPRRRALIEDAAVEQIALMA